MTIKVSENLSLLNSSSRDLKGIKSESIVRARTIRRSKGYISVVTCTMSVTITKVAP
jgi:hypothetical protein